MKGVADVEFILSVVIFLTVTTFVTFAIVSKIPNFRSDAYSEDLRDRVYSISELLLFDNGYPADWDQNTVKRVGLSTGEKYIISNSKATSLNALCGTESGYQKLRSLLSLDNLDVFISVIDSTNRELVRCVPSAVSTVQPKFEITRFGVLDTTGDIIRVIVSVF